MDGVWVGGCVTEELILVWKPTGIYGWIFFFFFDSAARV